MRIAGNTDTVVADLKGHFSGFIPIKLHLDLAARFPWESVFEGVENQFVDDKRAWNRLLDRKRRRRRGDCQRGSRTAVSLGANQDVRQTLEVGGEFDLREISG